MLRQVTERVRATPPTAIVWYVIEAIAVLVLVAALLNVIRQVYVNKAQIEIVLAQQRAEAAARDTFDRALRAELDGIYRDLYNPPPPDPARPPTAIESWQRNRDKELRDRITKLEQWRYRSER